MTSTLITSKKEALPYKHFPKKFVGVIWRNIDTVPIENIAKALGTTPENIRNTAELMGLCVNDAKTKLFKKRGYLTVIRNNWHLLNYVQICTLLDIDEEELAFILKEDDFMWHKMGRMKPDVGTVRYETLTPAETDVLRGYAQMLQEIKGADFVENAFDFLDDYSKIVIEPIPVGEPHGFDVVLEGSIRPDLDDDEMTAIYAQDFVDEIRGRFRTQLQFDNNASFCLSIRKTLQKKDKKTFTIAIQKDSICITGDDDACIYTALQMLHKKMVANKGPYLHKERIEKTVVFDPRFIYSYFALYGDALLDPTLDPYPDGLLKKLADCGINGIWMQGLLYQLSVFPFDPKLSQGYQARRTVLKNLIKKAKRFGIDIYLYFNEPRAMDQSFFERYPYLKGHPEEPFFALCTSQPRVQDYLYDAMKDLFSDVVELAGFFTITMSENLTNCHSRGGGLRQCPRCAERPAYEVVAQVNNLMARGAVAGNKTAKAIAWTWGWDPSWTKKAIEMLDPEIMLMCVNEEGMPLSIADQNPTVVDYTMTVPGPSERAKTNWKIAKRLNRKTLSKVQLNCTWELAAVPFVPLADICAERIRNIKKESVDGLMLSWTLGGCDSQNLDIAAMYYYEPVGSEALYDYYVSKFGKDDASIVQKAQSIFCEAFRSFPFHIGVLYTAPQNYAPAALFYDEPTGYRASMIGFPHDDLTTWKAVYSENVFLSQMQTLVNKWEKGLSHLRTCAHPDREPQAQLWTIASAVHAHFRSTVNHIRFVICRDAIKNGDHCCTPASECSIRDVIHDEIETVKGLMALRMQDSRIGYEASNHYFYTIQDLKEKLINLHQLLRHYK